MRPVLWDLYEEHLSEAAFLWTQWERALLSHRYTLEEIASGTEERLLAHLDGLVLGGPRVAQRFLLPVLKDEGAEADVFWAAAFAVLEARLPGVEVLVVKALSSEAPELGAAATRALELSSHPGLEARLRPLLSGEGPGALAALRVLSARGLDVADALDRLVAADDPALVVAALRRLGPAPTPHLRTAMERALEDGDPLAREAAREGGLVARSRPAWESCVEAVRAGEDSPAAMLAVAAGGEGSHLEPLLALADHPDRRAGALVALGYSGRVQAAEACLPWLDDKALGGLAAEAFAAITGAPVESLRVEPEDEGEGEGEEAQDGVEPEADLPRLDPERVAGWWKKQRPRLRPDVRLLGGAPWSAAALSAALREGPARRRPALALELAVRTQLPPADTGRWARAQLAAPPSTARFDDRGFADLCQR